MDPPTTGGLAATCSRGLEDVLAAEVAELGGSEVVAGRGVVRFAAGPRLMALACLGLRSAIRVLLPQVEGRVSTRDDLYGLARSVAWETWLPPGGTVAVEVAGQSRVFRHSRFVAQVVKDAVVDRVRELEGERPGVDLKRADLSIHAHLRGDRCSLALDAAGAPLSRRGYRPRGGPAPLNEALAAGLLLLAGYDGERPLLDPMTGTGTLAVEAAMIATRTAPGRGRRFAFEGWRDHEPSVVEAVRRELDARRRPAPHPIVAADLDPRAVAAASRNVREAGMERWVRVERGVASELQPPGEGALIVINPPYGHRLGAEPSSLASLYSTLGDRLKAVGAGCTAWILAGDRELVRHVGLRPARRIPVFNGPLECRWLRYDLFEGSGRRGAKMGGDRLAPGE